MSQPPYGVGGNDPNQGYGQQGGFGPNQGYGQPGGFGPSPGGYPGPGGYGPPPKSNTKLIIAVIVAAVLVVGGGVTAAVVLTQDDVPPPTVAADSTSAASTDSTSDAPTTSEGASESSERTSSDSQTQTPAPPPLNGPEGDLLALVPLDFDQTECESAELAGDGDIAHLLCGESQTQPGPTSSSFYLYQNSTQVADVFLQDVSSFGLTEVFGFECVANAGYSGYSALGSPEVAGFYSCRISDDGFAVIQWTFESAAFYGLVTIPGGQGELDDLWEWFQGNAIPRQ